jgi:hypothetical protein
MRRIESNECDAQGAQLVGFGTILVLWDKPQAAHLTLKNWTQTCSLHGR